MPLGPDPSDNIKQLVQDNKIKPPGQKRGQRQIVAIGINAAKSKMGVGQDKKKAFKPRKQ